VSRSEGGEEELDALTGALSEVREGDVVEDVVEEGVSKE
jgi:hypothetical protein